MRDLAEGNDDGAVLTALAVWDDLLAGRKTVADLATLLNSHVHDLRAAQEVVASPSAGLPAELATQHAELRDLLDGGDLAGKLGRITAIVSAITAHRAARLAELRASLIARVDAESTAIRARCPSVPSDVMAETLARFDQLVPASGEVVAVELLEARLDAVQKAATDVAHAIDKIVAKERLATVPIAEIAPDLIRTPGDLDLVVERLRKLVAELLGDDKEVRLT